MKILALTAENVKRLVAVHIEPDGSLVQITGKNGQGKTSVLDSIWWALGGASHIQAAPIRTGAKKARIRLDLGEIVVTRTFSKAKAGEKTTTSLTVESADGAVFRSPQKMLDELLGELSFDPLAFARAKPGEQIETLKRFVPDTDFDAIEQANAADYDKRRDVNRRAKELRAQAEGIDVPDESPEPVDESALIAELEAAHEHNADIERRQGNRDRTEAEARRLENSAARLTREADELRKQAAAKDREAEEAQQQANELLDKLVGIEALPEPIDPAGIRERLDDAKATNAIVAQVHRRGELEEEAEHLEAQSAALTDNMKFRDEEKAKAIANSSLPIDGLTFDADAVHLAGVPFEQASDAEQLRASVAIAAALNPQLRVVRVRHGNDLDSEGMQLLASFAEESGMQVWIERVADEGKVGFYIEDGSLVEHEQEAAEA